MVCFSLGAVENLLIWLVVIGAVFAIVKILLPPILAMLGAPAELIVRILTIVLWAAVLVIVIVVAFDLLACLVPLSRR